MMRYSSPFGISTQMNKTMIRLPIHAPSKSQDVWISSSKKKTTQNSVLSQSSKLLESKLSITNLTVDSSTFGSHDHKPEKKEKKEMNNKLKVAWHIKRRQSIIRREECKRKANLNRCFSLKSKQATIHSIHPPQEVRFSVNSWNQTFIDRTIQNLTVELKQLFNLRHFKKKEKLKTEQDKDQKANLGKTAQATNKSRDNLPKARYTRNDFMPNKHEISKKEIKKDDWLPWNEYSKARNLKQNERDVVAEWYDRNFSISLS